MLTAKDLVERFSRVGKPESLNAQEVVEIFSRFLPIIENLLDMKDELEFKPPTILEEVENLFITDLPMKGTDIDAVISEIEDRIIPHFNYENVKFFGYIPRSPTHVSMIGDALIPFFNQFLGAALASPSGNAIEGLVIKWIGEIFGYSGNFFGSFTIGGSHANLQGIYTGLINTIPWNVKQDGMIGDKRPVVYTSDQAHLCITKAVQQVGLGTKSLRKIQSDEHLRLDTEQLIKQIEKDVREENLLPVMIIASAGTTNTGAIDNIPKLREIANSYNMWLHIDAAYGGFAILADHPVAEQLKPLQLADSIATDTHKWFYTPMEGGLTLVKNANLLKEAYKASAEYLKDTELEEDYSIIRNFQDYGFALSRRWRGLMVWMNFMYYGTEGIGQLITRNILLADYFRQKISNHEEFQLFMESNLSVVCFKHPETEVNDLIFDKMMQESEFLIGRTTIHNQQTLRISILNENTEIRHIDLLFTRLCEILAEFKDELD